MASWMQQALADRSEGTLANVEVSAAAKEVAVALQHEARTNRVYAILALALEAAYERGRDEMGL